MAAVGRRAAPGASEYRLPLNPDLFKGHLDGKDVWGDSGDEAEEAKEKAPPFQSPELNWEQLSAAAAAAQAASDSRAAAQHRVRPQYELDDGPIQGFDAAGVEALAKGLGRRVSRQAQFLGHQELAPQAEWRYAYREGGAIDTVRAAADMALARDVPPLERLRRADEVHRTAADIKPSAEFRRVDGGRLQEQASLYNTREPVLYEEEAQWEDAFDFTKRRGGLADYAIPEVKRRPPRDSGDVHDEEGFTASTSLPQKDYASMTPEERQQRIDQAGKRRSNRLGRRQARKTDSVIEEVLNELDLDCEVMPMGTHYGNFFQCSVPPYATDLAGGVDEAQLDGACPLCDMIVRGLSKPARSGGHTFGPGCRRAKA